MKRSRLPIFPDFSWFFRGVPPKFGGSWGSKH
jgi:hypothetical protein